MSPRAVTSGLQVFGLHGDVHVLLSSGVLGGAGGRGQGEGGGGGGEDEGRRQGRRRGDGLAGTGDSAAPGAVAATDHVVGEHVAGGGSAVASARTERITVRKVRLEGGGEVGVADL